MSKNDEMAVAEKIRIVREHMGISQNEISKVIDRKGGTISRIEKGLSEYTGEQLAAVRKFLGIEKIPILEGEEASYRTDLYVWRDTINARRIDEARKMHHRLSAINHLPFETELIFLFKMFEVHLLFHEDVAKAEQALESARAFLDDVDDEGRFLFHFNIGSLNFRKKNYDIALQNFLMACDLQLDNSRMSIPMQYSISLCYSKLGMYFRSIVVTEKLLFLCNDDDLTDFYWYRLRNHLAINYIHIGEAEKARYLLGECLNRANSNKNDIYIGYALHNLGYTYLKTKDLEKALDYFQKAFSHMKEGQGSYFENLYYEIYCLILMNSSLSKKRLSHAKAISSGNEYYELLFNSLAHLISLKEDASTQYIEQNTITALLNRHEYFRALEYCDLLMDIFIKQNKKIKSLEIGTLSGDILRKIMKGGD